MSEKRLPMPAFPEADLEFEDHVIHEVEQHDGSYTIKHEGWCLWCGESCPVEPKVGDTARFYGKGIGHRIRGLFINGVKIWYLTPAEDEQKSYEDLYGRDAQDWLDRWDTSKGVFSIEMGGLGSGYEQAIQITAAEALRWFLANKPTWTDETWNDVRERLQASMFENDEVKKLGLSGAQYGAPVNLAGHLYRKGPIGVLKDERLKERHIQVNKHFP